MKTPTELEAARNAAHAAFDPLWRSSMTLLDLFQIYRASRRDGLAVACAFVAVPVFALLGSVFNG